MSNELAMATLALYTIQVFANVGNSRGIAYSDYNISLFLRSYVQVINSAPIIDDQLRFGNPLHFAKYW